MFEIIFKVPTAMMAEGMELATRTLAGFEAFFAPWPAISQGKPNHPSDHQEATRPVSTESSPLTHTPPTKAAGPIPTAPFTAPIHSSPTQSTDGLLDVRMASPALTTGTTSTEVSVKNMELETRLSEPPAKEAKKMSETFSDKNVTTVQYQVLFIKRDYETILLDTRTVVTQHLSADGFTAWRIADFISDMVNHGIPLTQEQARTLGPLEGTTFKPAYDPCDAKWPPPGVRLTGLSNDNNQYLRIEHQVISVISREDANYDEDQTKALQDIARRMPDPCDEKGQKSTHEHATSSSAGFNVS